MTRITERASEDLARARGLDRAIQIFEFLRRRRQSIGIGELAREIGAPRSSVYEIVARFVGAGILEVDENNEVFFGRSVYFYADAYLASQPLVRLGRDEAIRLAQLTGETTQLCMLVRNKYTVAFMHPGASLFRISSEAGVLVPIPWTASGRLLLGGMSDEAIRALIPPEDFRLPSGQIIEFEAFLQAVRTASSLNRTVTSALSDLKTTCLAAAIRDEANRPVATICFMVPVHTPPERQEIRSIRYQRALPDNGQIVGPAAS